MKEGNLKYERTLEGMMYRGLGLPEISEPFVGVGGLHKKDYKYSRITKVYKRFP